MKKVYKLLKTIKIKIMEATIGFKPGVWQKEINVSDFIKNNYTEYTGDETFLAGPTEATDQLWAQLCEMFKVEREKGIHNAETKNLLR
jgi:formate C-acetyltransferase